MRAPSAAVAYVDRAAVGLAHLPESRPFGFDSHRPLPANEPRTLVSNDTARAV